MTITSTIAAVPFSKKELLENFHKVHPIAQLSYCPQDFNIESKNPQNQFFIKLIRANSNFMFYYPRAYGTQAKAPALANLVASLPDGSRPLPIFAKSFMALAQDPEMKAFLDESDLGPGFVNYLDSMAKFPNKSCVVLLTKTIEDFIMGSCDQAFEQFDNLLNGKIYVSASRSRDLPQLVVSMTIGLAGKYKRANLEITPQLSVDGKLKLAVAVQDLITDDVPAGKAFITALLSQLADHAEISVSFSMRDWF